MFLPTNCCHYELLNFQISPVIQARLEGLSSVNNNGFLRSASTIAIGMSDPGYMMECSVAPDSSSLHRNYSIKSETSSTGKKKGENLNEVSVT